MVDFISSNRDKRFALVLGVVFFCFSVSAALLFQKLLLPLMSSVVAPGATLTTDSAYFHSVAVALANEIQQHGWSNWRLFPNSYVSGNVALLGALYALFGPDPALAIPLNAIFHALGGVLLFLIAMEISPNRTIGRYAGIIAATLFVVFPSALNWYGQIHKDGYAIVGLLLVLLIWIKACKPEQHRFKSWAWLFVIHFAAILFLGALRPYYLKLLFIIALGALLVMLIYRFRFKKKTPWVFFLAVLIALPLAKQITAFAGASEILEGNAYSTYQSTARNWKWQSSSLIPAFLDSQLETAARTRIGLIEYGKSVGARSMIDGEIVPNSGSELLVFVPRALQIAVLAPFPSTWAEELSPARMVATAEMAILYLCFPGLLFLWRSNRLILFAAYFAVAFLTVYGVTIANMGTLYRLRYPFEFILVLLGVIGWIIFLGRSSRTRKWLATLKTQKVDEVLPDPTQTASSDLNRKTIVGSGLIVMGLTFLGFIGFFVRDILMAYSFGLGSGMDDFFLALMLPMFVVTVFCTPLGSAFVPFYTSVQTSSRADAELTQHLSAVVFGILTLFCLLLYFTAPQVLALLSRTGSTEVYELMMPALLILWISGIVILGNAASNVHQSLVFPSVAQLIVPIIAISGLLLFGNRYGVMAVMVGMAIGLVLNLCLVQFHLKKMGISIFPKYQPKLNSSLIPFAKQLLPLLAAALFTGIALPINTMLAATLPEGNVSAFNLGSKVVFFISGVVGAAISTVMLPYFSSLIEKKGVHMARKELSLFLLIATFLSVPASVLMFLWAEPIVRVLFERGSFTNNDVVTVTHIMQYALIQIPFFVCNILLLKYATATRHSITITASALIGLVLNVAISLILMPKMGAAGIALAASISMLVSSALLVLALVSFRHISGLDAITVLLAWVLFLTLLISVHFQSTPSIVMTVITSFMLLLSYFGLMDRANGTLGT